EEEIATAKADESVKPTPAQVSVTIAEPRPNPTVENGNRIGKGATVRASNDLATRPADREAQKAKARAAKQQAQVEAAIEQKEAERAALAGEMNDPNFYLTRKDA